MNQIDDPAVAAGRSADVGDASTFRDPATQAAFARLGYQVVQLTDLATLREMRGLYDELGPAPGDPRAGFYPSNNSTSIEWKRTVDDRLLELLQPRIDELLVDHHAYHASFLVKWPGPEGEFLPHRDPSMVDDEGRTHGITIWCPLEESPAGERDHLGMLRLVPGTHTNARGLAGHARRYDPEPYTDVRDDIYDEFGVQPEVAPGDAVVFDHRIIHYSHPNTSSTPRLVVAVALRPNAARNVHVEYRDESVDVHAVDDEYFMGDRSDACERYPLVHRYERSELEPVTRDDLVAARATAGLPAVAGASPAPVAQASPDAQQPSAAHRPLGRIDALRALVRWEPAGVLTDPELDRRLGRDGFVAMPLLSAEAAGRVREAYGRIHGWEGSGFEVDFWSMDPAYRQAASDAIAAELDEPLRALFPGHEPLLRNFLVKWPDDVDDGAFPKAPHLDWMYTDERSGVVSHVVWIALEAIDHDNGQFRVARGSHRLDAGIRGMNLEAPWLLHHDVWEPRLLTIPAQAGDAVVTHAGTVHCSYPNLSGRPRVAAAVALRPRGAQLVHFRRLDDQRAVRHEVDESWFLTQRVDDLKEGRVDLPERGIVDVGGADLSPRALALQLDVQPLALLDRVRSARTQVPRRISSWRAGRASAPDEAGGTETDRPGVAARLRSLPARVVEANDRAVQRAHRATPSVGDPRSFPWVAGIEAAYPAIRRELVALLEHTRLPLIEEVTGTHQGNEGAWRTLVLMHDGHDVEELRSAMPQTMAAIASVPGARSGGFSLLEPGTHIPIHRGPDVGVLRYHLGAVVPGPPGACRLVVEGTELRWQEGESLIFDDAALHEAWNDSDQDRIVFVMDVDKPLPAHLRATTWLARQVLRRSGTGAEIRKRVRRSPS